MMNKTRIFTAIVIFACLGLQACGDGAQVQTSDTTTPDTTTSDTTTSGTTTSGTTTSGTTTSGTVDPLVGEVSQMFEPSSVTKITLNEGGLVAALESGDRFGRDHDAAGDINGDGIVDLIIGARSDDDGATDAGAAYILFMNADGTVNSNQKISALEGNFTEQLVERSFFGYGVAGIGDYDGDGVPDVAVSAPAAPVPAQTID